MQMHVSPKFGALVPIQSAKRVEMDGATKTYGPVANIINGQAIEAAIKIGKEEGQDLFRKLQAVDPSLKAGEPVILFVDNRNKTEPASYFVTGQKDVTTLRAKVIELAKKQLDQYFEKQNPLEFLPDYMRPSINIPMAAGVFGLIDEMKKSTTITSPVDLVETYKEAAVKPFLDRVFQITPHQD